MTSPHAPPGEKQSGERSRISWAYYPKAIRTNEIAGSVIITYHLPYDSKICHLHSSIRPFFERVVCKMFWTLLGYTVAKLCISPRNSTWFTKPFLLVRGWGLGTRLENTIPSFSTPARGYYLVAPLNSTVMVSSPQVLIIPIPAIPLLYKPT